MSTVPPQTCLAAILSLGVLLPACSGGRNLRSISVAPGNPSIAAGTAQPFVATGLYWNGAVRDLTGSVVWSSSNEAVAGVQRGLALALAPGTTTILATEERSGLRGWTELAVTPAVLASLAVTPAQPQIALGTGVQMTATATLTDGTLQDRTASVDWSSSPPAVASVSQTAGSVGLASGTSVGSTTLTATDPGSGIEGSTLLTVTPALLVSLAATPREPRIALGTGVQMTASGTFSDGTVQDLTASVQWNSSDASVATVSNVAGSEGRAASASVGVVTLTAVDPASGIEDSTELTVTAAVLTSVEVMPSAPSIALGTSLQFLATGTYSDATTQDLTDAVAWSSSDAAVATVSNAVGNEGLAAGASVGMATLTAVDPASGVDGSTTLTVGAAVLTSLAVTPADASIALGTDLQLVATGTFSDASTQDLTDSVTWSSSVPAVATVSNAAGSEGLATSASVGMATLTALHPPSGVDGSTTLSVGAAVLTSVAVTPADASIALGTDLQLVATGTYSDDTTQDLTDAVTWSSSDPAVATLSNAPGSEGLASSVAAGTITATASHPASGIDGSTALTVSAAALVSIAVTPDGWSVPTGSSRQLTATGLYADATTQDLTDAVTWTSSDPAVATVSNAGGSEGLATGAQAGAAILTATHAASGVDGAADLAVLPDIAFRAAASAASTAGLNLQVPTPAGTVAGDVLVAAIAVRPWTATITPPTGWTLVRRVDNATGNTSSLAVYRRVAVAGEPAGHTWTFSSSNGSAGAVAGFLGVDPASPVNVENGQSTPSSLQHDAPSVTTTRTRTMLVSAHALTSASSWTPPAGMTEALEVASVPVPNGAGISLELSYALQPAQGASGVKSAVAAADADTGNAHLLALDRGP